MIDNRVVGKTIATLRQSRGMTQQQLAAALNVSHQAVSKWENGAALPDIQTMEELTQLFGITMEQLLHGNIPASQPEGGFGGLDEHLHSIGSFFSGVIDDIGGMLRAPASEPTENRSEEQSVEGGEPAAPEAPAGKPEETTPEVDLNSLLQTAPFMTKAAVADTLRSCGRRLTPAEIARFAPFVDSACLEELIRGCDTEFTWDTLRRVAPFLRKEAVDAFARAIAFGQKTLGGCELPKVEPDVRKALDDIGRGVDEAVRNVIRFGENVGREMGKAFESLGAEQDSHASRREELRRQAFDRALQDGRWDWMAAHISELSDEDLKQRIAEAAITLGREEWVKENLPCFATEDAITAAIENGDWGWLGDHAWKLDIEVQHRIVRRAVEIGNWQWIASYAETLDLKDCVLELIDTARATGEKAVAAQLTKYDSTDELAEQAVMKALEEGDYEYFDLMTDALSADSLSRCCVSMAKLGAWEKALHYAEGLSSSALEWLTQIAIEQGEFDIIDRLDAMMVEKLPRE